MREMDVRHLRSLVTIVEEGTFSRAALRLGYTQSSVSQHVAAIERTLEGPVFTRPGGPTPVRTTPLGRVVIEHARVVLSRVDALADAVERFKVGDGRIDIGTFQSVSNGILPTLVSRLREAHPGCEIRLSEEEPVEPRLGDLDLLFCDGRLDEDAEPDVEQVLLLEDPYLLIARPGDLPDGRVSAAALHEKAMVAWPATCDQPRLERALTEAGADPHVVFRTAGNDTILSMVRAGIGSAVLPWLAIRHLLCPSCGDVHGGDRGIDRPLRVHELEQVPVREIHLAWPAGHPGQSPLVAHAIEIAVEIAGELSRTLAHESPRRPEPSGTDRMT